jgi:YjbE family integral membrane protein
MHWAIFSQADTLAALAQIVGVNILLSGDNAVVIALAARALPASQQQKAVVGGSIAAVAMRIALTFFAVALLQAPYLRLVGAALLLWIGIKLIESDDKDGESEIRAHTSLLAAVRTILVADLVMSLDNVLAVAAAARGDAVLVALGLAISIPLVIFGAKILIKVIERFPIVVTLGGALIGYTAGEMAVTDLAVQSWIDANVALLHQAAPFLCAGAVVGIGAIRNGRKQSAGEFG